jgi:hypothetical protein
MINHGNWDRMMAKIHLRRALTPFARRSIVAG